MAYREVDMWEILEVLRRLHRKENNAAIERATGRTRKTIRRYKRRERQRVTVRVADVAPGELAEVDFGRLGLVDDPDQDRRRVAWALLVTLAHSRHQYVHVTFTQTLADFIDGLEDAWEYFGGVPRRVVPDYVSGHIIGLLCPSPLFGRWGDLAICGGARAWSGNIIPQSEASQSSSA
jgi:transposase